MTKVFEAPDLAWAAMGLWWELMGFETARQAAAVLGVSSETLRGWRYGLKRQDSTGLLRMIRLLLWQYEGWTPTCFAAIHWERMEVEYVEDHDHKHPRYDPFYVSAPHGRYPGTKLPFGSTRDVAGIVAALTDLGNLQRPRLIALLGMPSAKTGAYGHVKGWVHGQTKIGPQYLLRILVLMLWDAAPGTFARLSDLWAVDWKARTVEYHHDYLRRYNEGQRFPEGPPSPFFRFLEYARRPGGLRRAPDPWWPPAALESAWDPRTDLPVTVAERDGGCRCVRSRDLARSRGRRGRRRPRAVGARRGPRQGRSADLVATAGAPGRHEPPAAGPGAARQPRNRPRQG